MMDNFWKVCGYDSFAREEYPIGEFETEAEAEVAAEKQRAANQTQPTELRDSVRILAPDDKDGD